MSFTTTKGEPHKGLSKDITGICVHDQYENQVRFFRERQKRGVVSCTWTSDGQLIKIRRVWSWEKNKMDNKGLRFLWATEMT